MVVPWLDLWLMFGLGLVSSLHCVQMCGPIVLAYSMPLRERRMAAHLAYNAGRIATYAVLGAAAGAFGLAWRLAGLAGAARVAAGAVMIAVAIVLVAPVRVPKLVQISGVGPMLRSPAASRKFGLGLILGFLPCGMIYAALLKALETGTVLGGALAMASFGFGTSGALLAIGTASSWFGPRIGRWGTALAAITVAITGVMLIVKGLQGCVHA